MKYVLCTAFVTLFVSILVVASTVQAADRFDTCRPIEVMTYTTRVHVRCENPVQGITYFAFPSSAASAGQMLSVLTTATVTGRDVTVLYDFADTRGTAFGCLAHDCRTLVAIGFWR